MNRPPTDQSATRQPRQGHGVPWLALFAADIAVSLVTLAVFGLFGGFVLLIALNGFDERTGGALILAYAAVVLAGNALFACLVNWLILRARGGAGARAVLVPAVTTTAVTLFAGPPVAVILIKLLFGGGT